MSSNRAPGVQLLVSLRHIQNDSKRGASASMDDIRLLRKLNAVGPFTYFKLPLPSCAIRNDEAERSTDSVAHWHRMIIKTIQWSQKVRLDNISGSWAQ